MAAFLLLATQSRGTAQDAAGLERLEVFRNADAAALLDALQVHRHEAGGLWHFLLEHFADELEPVDETANPDFPTRIAEALNQILTTSTFTEDLVALRHMPVHERSRRKALLLELADARQQERAAHAASDEIAVLKTSAHSSAVCAKCTAFADRFEDREFQRHLSLTDAARARVLPDTSWKERSRALVRCTDLFQRHDLLTDSSARLVLIESAALNLRHESPVLAESQLASLGVTMDLPPFARAQVSSLRAIVAHQRGFFADEAAHLEQLFGLLDALGREPLDHPSRELLAEWHLQAADHLLRTQRTAAALTLLQHLPEETAVRAGIATRLALVEARAALELGRTSESHRAAEAAIRAGEKITSSEPESVQRCELVVEAKLIRADAELRLERVVTARSTLASIAPDALARTSAAIRSERELLAARIASADGKFAEALATVERAIDVATTPAAMDARIRALWAQSRLFAQIGDSERAVAAAEDAVALAPGAIRDPKLCCDAARINLATILVSFGRLADAEEQLPEPRAPTDLDDAQTKLAHARILRLQAEILWRRAALGADAPRELAEVRRELARAVNRIAEAKPAAESVLAPLDASEVLRGYLLLQELDLGDKGPFAGEPWVCAAQAWLENIATHHPHLLHGPVGIEAPALVEAMRARAHEARGSNGEALDAWRRAAGCETQLRAQMGLLAPDGLSMRFEFIHDRIAGLLLERAANVATPGAAREALLELDHLRARSLKARRVMIARGSGSSGTESLSWRQTLDLLVPGRVVVAHAFTTRGAFVLACDAERIACARIVMDRGTLLRKLHVWRRSMEWTAAPFQSEVASSEGHALWKVLFDPVAHVLTGAREICCLAPAELSSIPFAALLTQPFAPPRGSTDWSRAPFLVARGSVESVAAIPCLAMLQPLPFVGARETTERVLLVADPATPLPALPGSRLEGDLIRRLYGDRASVLAGTAARRGAVLDELRSSPTIIHFATHAVAGDWGAELALAGTDKRDSRLRGADLRDLRLPSRPLVVLASCCSAEGSAAGYEGVIGLPHAFLAAGASCVVAACMPVADTPSATLLTGFYEELRAHPARTPGAALCKVQRDCAKAARTSWPGHWAPWLAFGHP